MSEGEIFVVGDRQQRSERRRTESKKNEESNIVKNSDLEFLKNLVGPSYLGFGIYGFFNGIYKSTKEITFKNRPKKLIVTNLLNVIGRQASKYANAGGCICLIYGLIRKTTSFLFEEELQALLPYQKEFIFGFLSGAVFKSSRGLGPSLFAGSLLGLSCSGFVLLYESNYIKFKLH